MASAQILNNSKAMYVWNGTNWLPLNAQNYIVNSTRWQKVATGGETTLSGADDNGSILYYSPGYEQVFLNGILLVRNDDYTANDGVSISGLSALSASTNIEIIALKQLTLANTYTKQQLEDKFLTTFDRWTKTISASGTVLSGFDDDGNPLLYTAGVEQVYVNGILLAPEEYVATSGSTVVLDEAVVNGDIVQVHNLETIGYADIYTKNQSDTRYLLNSASANFEPNIPYVSASPSIPSAGTLWIDSTNSAAPALKVYNGTTWIAVSGASEAGLHPFFQAGI